jgi:multiple sugar transport system permease protein/putative aldouronate transport system permease protein
LNAILTTADFGFTAATTFYQSIVGFVLIITANGIVRKAAPDNALF